MSCAVKPSPKRPFLDSGKWASVDTKSAELSKDAGSQRRCEAVACPGNMDEVVSVAKLFAVGA